MSKKQTQRQRGRRVHERRIKIVMADIKKLVKKYGLVDVRTAANSYLAAVRHMAKLKRQVADAEAEIYPTVAFAVDFTIPDGLFEQAKWVIAEIAVDQK